MHGNSNIKEQQQQVKHGHTKVYRYSMIAELLPSRLTFPPFRTAYKARAALFCKRWRLDKSPARDSEPLATRPARQFR
jgi:hypothetical protein